jgi:hypothetical protein
METYRYGVYQKRKAHMAKGNTHQKKEVKKAKKVAA